MKRFLIKAFLRLFSWLPLCVHHFNAHIIGWIASLTYRTKVVRSNIDHAFPEKTEKERRKIFRAFYLHFGQIITETIWFGGSSPRRLSRSRIITVKNPDELRRLAAKPEGTIVMFAHTGNWEVLAGFPYFDYGPEGSPLTVANTAEVYKRLTDKVWDDIIRENRLHALGKDYDNYVETNSILRHILEHKNQGMFYFLCTDQWPYGSAKGYTHVTFMHRKTRSMTAAAAVARKLNMAVTYLSIVRNPNGRKYVVELKPIADNASELPEQEIIEKYYKYIEEDIYADPGNYLWSHRRWKKAPDTQ